MEYLPNGLTLEIPAGCFPLSTDSMLLAHFVKLPRSARVLDLGSGCGTLGLLLCASDPGCTVTGAELDPGAHEAALSNIARNGLEARLTSICADLRELDAQIVSGCHCCVSNPPYFSGGPASAAAPLARRDDFCPPEALFQAASRCLRYGGDFFLVHRPESLAQLIACGAPEGLEAKRLRLVRHRAGGPITWVLLQFRKGGKPGLAIDEFELYDAQGAQTPYYRAVYHIQEA